MATGKKNSNSSQKRIEYRGKNLRASRTGGVSLRVEKKAGPVNLTANTKKGVRASAKVAKGTRAGFQNGRFFLTGRWSKGPFGLNLSKTGFSLSVKTALGRLNLTKPQYSSAKVAGIQIRGRKAAQLLLLAAIFNLCVFVTGAALYLALWIVWLLLLPLLFLIDLVITKFRKTSPQE